MYINDIPHEEKRKTEEKRPDRQIMDHLEFLGRLGFIITELTFDRWVKCSSLESSNPTGSYCYITRANQLRSGGFGLITTAKRHGETFVHRTLPRNGEDLLFGFSDSTPTKPEGQTVEDLRRVEFLWSKASIDGSSGYLKVKGVLPYSGLRFSDTKKYGRSLVVPLRDKHKTLRGLQYIADDGTKRIVGQLKGNAFRIGTVGQRASVMICEGVATALFLHEVTELSVFAGISCCNLLPIAKLVRDIYPDHRIIICGDNDRHLKENAGKLAAQAASLAVNGIAAVPEFGDLPPSKSTTDWLDLAMLDREEAFRQLKAHVDPI